MKSSERHSCFWVHQASGVGGCSFSGQESGLSSKLLATGQEPFSSGEAATKTTAAALRGACSNERRSTPLSAPSTVRPTPLIHSPSSSEFWEPNPLLLTQGWHVMAQRPNLDHFFYMVHQLRIVFFFLHF